MRVAIARDAEAAPPTGLKSDMLRDLKLIKWMAVAVLGLNFATLAMP
jgi:hypothetical protein